MPFDRGAPSGSLTIDGRARKIDWMVERVRRMAVVAILAVTLTGSALSSCMAGEIDPGIQMACCKAGHHDCGSGGDPADCCTKEKPPEQQFFVAKKQAPDCAVLAPLAVFASRGLEHRLPTSPIVRHSRVASLATPSPPVYVLTSAFLI